VAAVIGVDLAGQRPAVADRAVVKGQSVAERTHRRLSSFSAPEAKEAVAGDEKARLGLGYVAAEDDVAVIDEAICEPLSRVARRQRWSTLTTLEELNGAPAFVPLVSR
jgi:hypothetical protein